MNYKQITKNILSILILSTIPILSLIANGTNETKEIEPLQLVSERGTHTEAWKTEMAPFEAETGIDLEITQHPYANYFDQLMLSYTGNQGEYDVPYISLLWYPTLANAGYIQPLNEFIENDPTLPEDMPGLQSAKINGNYYFIPYMNEVGGIVYRKDLFEDETEKKNFKEKYGYELTPPKTLEQYKDIAEFFTRPPELYGVTLMGKRSIFLATHFMNRLWANGGNLLDENYEPIFDNEIGVESLEQVKDFFNYSSPSSYSYDFQEALTEFKMGKSAMAELWTTAMFHVDDPESSKVVGKASFVGFPKPENAINEKRPRLFISWGFAVSDTCKQKDKALEWIKYATSTDALAQTAHLGTIPTRLSAMNNTQLIEELPWIPQFQEALDTCIPTPMVPLIPEGMSIVNGFIAPMVSEYISGNGSAQELLSEAAKSTKDLLQENGYY
jgi:multiple sugar transport system substrate-binding protein